MRQEQLSSFPDLQQHQTRSCRQSAESSVPVLSWSAPSAMHRSPLLTFPATLLTTLRTRRNSSQPFLCVRVTVVVSTCGLSGSKHHGVANTLIPDPAGGGQVRPGVLIRVLPCEFFELKLGSGREVVASSCSLLVKWGESECGCCLCPKKAALRGHSRPGDGGGQTRNPQKVPLPRPGVLAPSGVRGAAGFCVSRPDWVS